MSDLQRWMIWCFAFGVASTLAISFWMFVHILANVPSLLFFLPGFAILIGVVTSFLYAERFLARLIIFTQFIYYVIWFIYMDCKLSGCEFSERFIEAVSFIVVWHLTIIAFLTIAHWQRRKIKWRYAARSETSSPSP